jgi:penicillin-binding protein 1A
MVEDAPVTIGDWSPANADGRYRGLVSLREAFALSSNVAAARLADRVGIAAVADAARDLGITSRLDRTPSMALGTSGLSLLELTSAYASAASGRYPTRPVGLLSLMPPASDRERDQEQFDAETHWPMLLDILWFSTNAGTGRAAALDFPTFGKTGTSQDNRDAVFVGFAGDLIAAIWVGYDDNRPLGDVHGGDVPALIWRDFMQRADRAGAVDRAYARPFTARFVPEPEEPPSKPEDDGFVTVERRFDPEPFAEPEFEPELEPADRFRERPRDRKRKPDRGRGRQR